MAWFDIFRNKSHSAAPQNWANDLSVTKQVFFQMMGLGSRSPMAVTDTSLGYIEQGFHGNPFLYAVVSGIAKLVASLPYYFAEDVNGEENRLSGSELRRTAKIKALLERPNHNQIYDELIYQLTSLYMISEVCYIYMPQRTLGNGKDPHRLYVLSDHEVSVVWESESLKIPRYYDIPALANARNIPPDRMIVFRNPDLSGVRAGRSPLAAANQMLSKSNTAITASATMQANMGAVGFVSMEDMGATPDDAKSLETAYSAKQMGPMENGKIAFTNAKINFVKTGQSPKELEMTETDLAALRAFCAIYNAPSQLFGDVGGSTYSNYREARRALYTNAVLPMFKVIHAKLSWMLYPLFSEGVTLYTVADTSQIAELQDDFEKTSRAVDLLVNSGIYTRNEARLALGQTASDVPEMDMNFVGGLPIDRIVADIDYNLASDGNNG
jgi:HK97 family phage portal protein